jgi:hypothetical protein
MILLRPARAAAGLFFLDLVNRMRRRAAPLQAFVDAGIAA